MLRRAPVRPASRVAPARPVAAPRRNYVELKKSTKLWGGRFSRDVDRSILSWTESITIDRHIATEDLWGSMAHVSMLGAQGIIPPKAAAAILPTLKKFQDDFVSGAWQLGHEQEDVHMNVEKKLIDTIGMDLGGRMHTCRSRNDQVVLDSKLYARKRLLELRQRMIPLVKSFLDRAAKHPEDVMTSYTHVQHAQPVSVAFWLSHYAAIFLRDMTRLKAAYDVTDENPLGGGAISGTSFPIDRKLTTELMGFQKVHEHSLDATSARDFMLDALTSSTTLMTTISRLAEEFILWSSWEFQSIILDDGFAMGSSMMPQKKNPGVLELLRGRMGRMNGLMTAGFTMMKGLPSGYNRDFHEDKEILVEALSLINRAVEVIPPLIESSTFNLKRMEQLAAANFGTATELANFLVLRHNVPFREAHHVVGSLVGDLYRSGKNFSEFQVCYDHITKKHGIKATPEDVRAVLDPKTVMMSYNSQGGTGKVAVEKMIKDMYAALDAHSKVVAADKARVDNAYNRTRKIAAAAGAVQSRDDLKKLIATTK